ncbi:MAG: HDOD domain-containing protein [Deltaproteobacteria bacterium]|jgi:putative nucleotidyltransferase with HDIG domain|nr:HDOD domain-containing protein [Deltaproteobacteria bacterium]
MEFTSLPQKPLLGIALKKKLYRCLDRVLPLPEVIMKAQKLLTDPNSKFEELANIIETDQEITLKSLKVANSAYYSLKNEVRSVRQACVILGLKVIAEIVMTAGMATLYNRALRAYNMSPKDLWRHSLATALSARKIADAVRTDMGNEAFLAGLFHDAGKLILDEQIFSRKKAFKNFLGDSPKTHYEAEKQILGVDHSEIAAELCNRWKFPKAVTRAIRHHHNINPNQVDDLTYILHAADNLTKMDGNVISGGCALYELDEQVILFLALTENDLDEIMAEVNQSVSQIGTEIFGNA